VYKNSFLLTSPPHWKIPSPGIKHRLPPEVYSWLYEKNSLTRRLRQIYGEQLTVKILFHCWKPAFLSECNALKMPFQQFNLIREVLLQANEQPLILARTILPQKTIKIAKRNLSHLGTRPLGEVIFSYPKLERSGFHICHLPPTIWQTELKQTINISQPVWGRRTVYAIHQQPLLVSEFFLPAALKTAEIGCEFATY